MRKLLLALLLLPLFAVLSPGMAGAEAKYTTKTLAKVLVSQDELNAVLRKRELKISDVIDIDPSTDPIAVGRVYAGANGELIDISLFSPDDGSMIKGSRKDNILSADSARKFADSTFTKIKDFEEYGDVLGDDFAASFTGTFDGKVYQVTEVIFVKDNVYGLVLYATTGENDPTDLGMIYGLQLAKFN